MIAQKRNEELFTPVLKDEAEITVAAALEKLAPQFTDTEAAVHMRLAKTINEIARGQEAFYFFRLRKMPQPTNDRRIDGKDLIQAYPAAVSR